MTLEAQHQLVVGDSIQNDPASPEDANASAPDTAQCRNSSSIMGCTPATHDLDDFELDHLRHRLDADQYEEYDQWTTHLIRSTGYSDYMHLADFEAIRHWIFSDEVYFATLGYVWNMVEFPNREWQSIGPCFRPRNRRRRYEFLMSPSELAVLRSLADPVTIYRGVSEYPWNGWSWTLDRPTAVWFARRWVFDDTPCFVLTAQVRKQRIIAYLADRNEAEILVCPKVLTCEEIELSAKPDQAERDEQAARFEATLQWQEEAMKRVGRMVALKCQADGRKTQ